METKKLESAPLSKGQNEEHLQLISGIATIVEGGLISRTTMTGMSDNILAMNNLLKEKLAIEDKSILALSQNEMTEPIAESDKERDSINSGFRYYVRAYSFSLDAEKVEAARRIQVIIDNYGDMNRRSYNKQSEATKNFLQDIDKYHAADITTIGAEWWIDELEEKNNRVISLMDERFSLNVDRLSEDVRIIRSEVDSIYYQIAAMLEAGYILSEGAMYSNIIDQINERLRYFKNSIAQRKGRQEANKEKEKQNKK